MDALRLRGAAVAGRRGHREQVGRDGTAGRRRRRQQQHVIAERLAERGGALGDKPPQIVQGQIATGRLRALDQLARHQAVVEVAGPDRAQPRQHAREIGLTELRALAHQPAVGAGEQPLHRVVDALGDLGLVEIVGERARHLGTQARQLLGRAEQLVPRQLAEPRMQQRHAAYVGRHRHRAAGGRPGQEVDHLHALLERVVGDADAAAAEPGGRRQGDAEREIGGDRGIAGGAALGQHLAPDQRRVGLVGDHRARIAGVGRAKEAARVAAGYAERQDDREKPQRQRELTPPRVALS